MMQSVIGVPTAIVEIIRGLIIIFAVAGMAAVKLPKSVYSKRRYAMNLTGASLVLAMLPKPRTAPLS